MLRVLVERAGEVIHDASFSSEWVSVGRDPANDIVVEDPLVSARHLSIRAERPGDAYRVIDNSSNGTFLAGQRISTLKFDAPTSLAIGDLRLTLIPVLRSGTDRVAITDLYASTAIDTLPSAPERRTTRVPHDIEAAELRCLSPGGVPRALVFEHSAMIGRAAECDLKLSSADISRRHCLVVSVDRGYVIKRLSKKNPVAVNSRPVELGDTVPLQDGDVITVCDEELVFFYPATRPVREVQAAVPMEAAPNVDLAVTRRACSDHGVAALDVVGFLGAKTWAKFEERVMAELAGGHPVLLDLGYLLGMDGSGIASMSRVLTRAGELGTGVQLIRVTPRVADLLELSPEWPELTKFISRTEHTAITKLRGEQPAGGA